MKRTVLVTGGTSGIGLAALRRFHEKGYEIYSVSRSIEKIKKAKKEFPDATFFMADVTDREALLALSGRIADECGKLDVLVNAAGIIKKGGLEDMNEKDFEDVIDINMKSVFYVTRAVLPLLKKGDSPSVVNVSSISSTMGGSCIAYCTAKAGVDRMTQFMARELAKYAIRVNSVNPGLISSGFQVNNNTISESDFQSHLEKMESLYPLGIGTSEDVADLIMFLVSEKAKWISGANYLIDGARSTKN